MKYVPPSSDIFSLHQRRPGEEEKKLGKCVAPPPQACDQLDEELELPLKESTSGENCPDSFTSV